MMQFVNILHIKKKLSLQTRKRKFYQSMKNKKRMHHIDFFFCKKDHKYP